MIPLILGIDSRFSESVPDSGSAPLSIGAERWNPNRAGNSEDGSYPSHSSSLQIPHQPAGSEGPLPWPRHCLESASAALSARWEAFLRHGPPPSLRLWPISFCRRGRNLDLYRLPFPTERRRILWRARRQEPSNLPRSPG